MGPAAGQLFTRTRMAIERFNGRAISSTAELRQAIAALKPGEVVSITARLADGSHTIVNFRARS